MSPSFTIDFLPPPISVELHIGHQLMQDDLLVPLCEKYGKRNVIIADSFIKERYGIPLSKALSAELIVIPRGEKAKTRKIKHSVEDQLLNRKYDRETVIIGLGGGATLDLAGFVASTYLRGIPLVLLPTTLLAMVDASIGGKTSVDTHYGKNLIGSYYHPKAIISDLDCLHTLPKREKRNGFSEILKMGLIFDPEIFHPIHTTDSLETWIIKAAHAKIKVISQDPFEKGLRRILNFGHTIGHALESISRFKISHGEAIAIGAITESYLSRHLGYLSEFEFQNIKEMYDSIFGSLKLPKMYERKSLLQALSFDKKKSIDGIRFVLIDKIGHAIPFNGEYCRVVQEEDIVIALAYMEHLYG